MSEWITAPEAIMCFRTAESQLEEFSSRGNLGTKVSNTGQRLYKRSQLELIFPTQTDRIDYPAPTQSWGQLGETKLGKTGN